MATRKFTSVAATPASAATMPAGSDASSTQLLFGNPVLTRTAPKGAVNSWAMLLPLGALIVVGAGYWAYTEMRPAPLMDNAGVVSAPPPAAAVAQPVAPATPAPVVAADAAVTPTVTTPAAPVRRYAEATPTRRAPVHHRAAASDSASPSTPADTSSVTTPPPAMSAPPAVSVPNNGPVIEAPPPASGTP